MTDISYEDIVKRWQERRIDTIADLDTALSNYRILFAYHSNRIEGAGTSLHQTREIFENGKVMNYTGDLRAIFETQNQKVCYEYLKEKIVQRQKITPELVCDVHYFLNQGCYDESRWIKGERPGSYKKNYYGVGSNAGVLPEDVDGEVRFLCDEVADESRYECGGTVDEARALHDRILTAAAYFHCNFENIHPFADGNGRTGRTLMNYFLMIHNIPPAVIYEEDKETYYLALSVFDQMEKLDGFVRFIKEQTVKTWVSESKLRSRKSQKIICL